MAKKAAKKLKAVPADFKGTVIAAAFTLAAQLGWAHVTMSDIAQESGYSLAELAEHFESKGDILAAYERKVNSRVLAGAGAQAEDNPRDALFDLLMDRFEILNEERAALTSILSSFKLDPKDALLALPHLGRAMAWMLEAAGVDTTGWRGAARIAGLTGVYLAALKAWMGDEATDLPKTMAALDKNLGRAEEWAERFSL